ncbi:MAG TPA: zinc ABC transporter substrate-binding protein [Thermoplasmata archaeon]|nr:zinc ABC transporter substrate-binding protein [Thermoplasmata archaeon]
MKELTKAGLAVAVVAIIGSAAAYEVLTSRAPASPCASYTAEQLGAHGSPGTVTGNTTANYAGGTSTNGPIRTVPLGETIKIVAAENFWGNLVGQLGGNLTSVLSIVSDPNADPHEYDANTSDAAAVATANFVIVNGVGYDDWALKLLSASNSPGQEILNVGTLNGVFVDGGIVTGNPHMWYDPVYVNHTLLALYSDLVAIQPQSRAAFQADFASLNTSDGGASQGVSIDQLYARANQIKTEFQGTVVASTESVFVYLANYTGLDLISPQEFMKAVAEGNDPPAASVALFQCQVQGGYVKVLIYNVQTDTPVTTTIKALAPNNNVTTTFVSETIQPPGTSFQNWMYGEYSNLLNALNAERLAR